MTSSLAREIAALETIEAVIARLTVDPERDDAISRLLVALAQDRERLLAEIIRAQQAGRDPFRFAGTSPASIGAPAEARARPAQADSDRDREADDASRVSRA